uniref:Uncharacterized protein n=2 Tax=Ixodes ricinus TaxID=34613 RepID=A0A090XA83_IXORI
MTHWVVHPLRGWLAFLSLTNLGTGLRCLWEQGFMQQRIFTELKTSDGLPGCPEMERTFGFWSVFNAILFLHLQYLPRGSHRSFRRPSSRSPSTWPTLPNEAFVHHSISRGRSCPFPRFFLSALTMLWLAVAYKFIWPSSRKEDDDDNENEHLAERLSTQQPRLRRKTKSS